VETVLYRFTGGSDGAYPTGKLAFDHAGNVYGTTLAGGDFSCYYGCGVVYKLGLSGGGWTESVIHSFGQDDLQPEGVIADNAGNLYGTNQGTFTHPGTIYQLTPSEGGWTETALHIFDGYDGAGPNDLIFDPAGNLYGMTGAGGSHRGGTAFMLSPVPGGWTFNLLYNFLGGGTGWGNGGPSDGPVMDAAGNLYGSTIWEGDYQEGNVFKLAPSGSGWTYTSLKDFSGGTDGFAPGGLVFGANGNLYGPAAGGAYGYGFIWEITP
jgi:uncharacterized repeat protein (TIGR03803 family)